MVWTSRAVRRTPGSWSPCPAGRPNSSVTAALLKSEGYDVVGITLQLYDHGAATHRKGACCAGQDIHDARDVAERIGIPHYVLDYEDRFRDKSVIDNFAASYVSGETPVPCIECNRSIKFRDLLGTARELGATTLATGAVCRLVPDGARALFCAADSDRDQSYFLFATTRDQLDYLRFPTRRHDQAASSRTGAALRSRSGRQARQPGRCFRADRALHEVVYGQLANAIEPGDIVDLAGRVMRGRQGIVHFTVGQRRGLGMASSAPLYVVRLDAESRRVVVRRAPRAPDGAAQHATGLATARSTAR